MDFISDALANGRRIKVLTIVDDFTNDRFRDECLNDHWFASLTEARIRISAWRRDYNEHRPHSALSYQTPAEFAASCRMQKAKENQRL
ncbi:MAG: hypothetical protein NTAFB09_22030 [Nitrosospira sp.]